VPSTELLLVFWSAAALVAYSYFGYPALLALLARLRPAPPVRKAPLTPPVSLIMVVHDEEKNLPAKLRNCLDLDYPRDRLEILVASDGSRDGTDEIVRSFAADGVRLLSLPGPRGKPAALNRAVPEARGEILVLCDARQRLDREAVRELASNFADPTVGAVSGELHLEVPAKAAAGTGGVGLYWKYEKLCRRLESRIDSTVGDTGALYALRRHLFRPLDPRTILDDVAIPMDVVEAGYRVVFEAGAKVYDQVAETPEKEYGRKVRTLAGNYQLVALRPSLLHPRRNRLFWQFVSHKLSRLLVPWCLLALLASSLGLSLEENVFYRTLLGAQVLFYALALLGSLERRLRIPVRGISFPYAFTLLNMAAASSLFGFLRGRQRAAWKGVVS
jgi:biofilm PGA synthesis N-glycosyltransferase PgaC